MPTMLIKEFMDLCHRHGLKIDMSNKRRVSPAAQEARLKRLLRELDEGRPPEEDER